MSSESSNQTREEKQMLLALANVKMAAPADSKQAIMNNERKPAAAASKKGDPPDFVEAPINILLQLRTTALCCNRIFSEQGITHLIVDYYQDYLAMDAVQRILKVGIQMEQLASDAEWYDARVDEVVGYVTLYQNKGSFMMKVMATLSAMALQQEDFVHDTLSRTLQLLMQSARQQVYPRGLAMVGLLSNTVFKMPQDFLVNLVTLNLAYESRSVILANALLEARVLDLLLAVFEDAVAADRPNYVFQLLLPSIQSLVVYLSERPAHPLAGRRIQLMPARLTINRRLGLRQFAAHATDDEEEDMDDEMEE